MRLITSTILLGLVLPLAVGAQDSRQTYKWVDDEGQAHYGDSVPPEYADKRKAVLNEQGVAVGQVEGKKTEEQLAAEEKEKELEMQRELQLRADKALLATYLTQEEIEMHRDRRVELFRAQARVTELYLRNLSRRLDQLKQEAGRYRPYSSDPNAEMIDPSLVEEIEETDDAIGRHEQNLQKFRQEERDIIDRFDGDIRRFRILKGIDEVTTRVVEQQSASSTDGVPQIVPE
jgi:hypothetical protein